MQKRLLLAVLSCGIATLAVTPIYSADPPKPEAKAPDADDTLSEAQQSLLLQLSDAEANIRALNLALIRTGYKVGLAYSRIESSQKGNEEMDRKAGGPVGWQDFYGKTARSFYIPTSEATLHSQSIGHRTDIHVATGIHPIQRPSQFDYIYKANNDQAARAREQVAQLAQDQATLLARRQKHEADQSRLWAMLAFERITDREIADEPICRFKLKSNAAGADPRIPILRALVLFLRHADQIATASLESVKSDQIGTFTDLATRMKNAYSSLRASLADATPAVDPRPEDKKQADALKSLCKQIWDESSIVADNYRNALDRDQAKEDNSKLVFRGKLQESLAKFAAMTAELDFQIADTSKSWNISATPGTESPDKLAALLANGPAGSSGSGEVITASAQLQKAAESAFRQAAEFKDFADGMGSTFYSRMRGDNPWHTQLEALITATQDMSHVATSGAISSAKITSCYDAVDALIRRCETPYPRARPEFKKAVVRFGQALHRFRKDTLEAIAPDNKAGVNSQASPGTSH